MRSQTYECDRTRDNYNTHELFNLIAVTEPMIVRSTLLSHTCMCFRWYKYGVIFLASICHSLSLHLLISGHFLHSFLFFALAFLLVSHFFPSSSSSTMTVLAESINSVCIIHIQSPLLRHHVTLLTWLIISDTMSHCLLG